MSVWSPHMHTCGHASMVNVCYVCVSVRHVCVHTHERRHRSTCLGASWRIERVYVTCTYMQTTLLRSVHEYYFSTCSVTNRYIHMQRYLHAYMKVQESCMCMRRTLCLAHIHMIINCIDNANIFDVHGCFLHGCFHDLPLRTCTLGKILLPMRMQRDIPSMWCIQEEGWILHVSVRACIYICSHATSHKNRRVCLCECMGCRLKYRSAWACTSVWWNRIIKGMNKLTERRRWVRVGLVRGTYNCARCRCVTACQCAIHIILIQELQRLPMHCDTDIE